MKKIVENIPIFTVCLVYFGFCNLHYYYKEFKIDIYNYISNTELVLSFLPIIVITATTFYGFVYQLLLQKVEPASEQSIMHSEDIKKEDQAALPRKKSKILATLRSLPVLILLLFLVEGGISMLLKKVFKVPEYELQWFNVTSALVFCFVVYFARNVRNNPSLFTENFFLISIFTVIFIGLQISNYRRLDALKIKAGKQDKQLHLIYNHQSISTTNKIVYIGQTQSNLFLYNMADSSTLILKMENVDSMVVK